MSKHNGNITNKIFKLTCNLACKIFNATGTITENFRKALKNEKGMLILCNHLSSLDFLFTSQTILNENIACVIADNMKFSNKKLSSIINNLNVIYKKQYYPDLHCIKTIKDCIDHGVSVVLCPEGKVSQEGITSKIIPTTGKLVKLLNCDVGVIVCKGAGLTRPKWAYSTRFGRIESNAKMILSGSDLDKLSVSDINKIIQDNLYNNEYEYQKENHLKFIGKKYAEGIERVLYKCPKCGSEFTQRTHKNIIRCSKCGNEIKYLSTGEIVPINNSLCPEDIPHWIDDEKNSIRKSIESGNIYQEYKVWLFKGNEFSHSYDYVTDGLLSYDGEKIMFLSFDNKRYQDIKLNFNISYMTSHIKRLKSPKKIDDLYLNMIFNLKNVPSIANIPGDAIDLINEKGTFRFMFYDKRGSSKLVYSIEEKYLLK